MAYISFQPSGNYSTKLYTGTGSSLAITGVGFQPDLVWIKNRDQTDFHVFTDAVRGATYYLETDDGLGQTTNAESVKSFDADGFTVGTMIQNNTNTEDFVSWNWRMGTTTGIAGSPSTTPTAYSFNATAGQSIIQYEGTGVAGATIPHGLGTAPQMVIIKNIDRAEAWPVYHQAMGAEKYMLLNTSAIYGDNTYFNDTTPTSTLVTVGNAWQVNKSGDTYMAYCFTPIKGYSRFGTYDGYSNADGPFCYTGFRPAYVLIKIYNSGDPKNWVQDDDKRLGYNEENYALFPNTNGIEDVQDTIDILSNGFKIRRTDDTLNTAGLKYIYAAFAAFPLVSSNDVPGVAR